MFGRRRRHKKGIIARTVKALEPKPAFKRRDFYDPQKHGLRAVLFGRRKRK